MKNGKAAGPGGLCFELFKYGGVKVYKLVTKLIKNTLSGDDIPEEIKLGYISSIYKKGDHKLCKNYRGICATNPVMRIICKILSNHLQCKFIGSEVQCGFTSGLSCVDHVFIVRQILEKCEAKKQRNQYDI